MTGQTVVSPKTGERIRVVLDDQVGTSHRPAEVKIYIDDALVVHVTASIDQRPGADGRLYPCVTLEKKDV